MCVTPILRCRSSSNRNIDKRKKWEFVEVINFCSWFDDDSGRGGRVGDSDDEEVDVSKDSVRRRVAEACRWCARSSLAVLLLAPSLSARRQSVPPLGGHTSARSLHRGSKWEEKERQVRQQQSRRDTAGQLMTVRLRRPNGHWKLCPRRTPVPLPPMVAGFWGGPSGVVRRARYQATAPQSMSLSLTVTLTTDNFGLIVRLGESKKKDIQRYKSRHKSVSNYRFGVKEVPTATTQVRYRTRSQTLFFSTPTAPQK